MLIPNITCILLVNRNLKVKNCQIRPILWHGALIPKNSIFFSDFFFKMKILRRLQYAEFYSASFCQNSFFIIMHYMPEIAGKVLKKYFLVAKMHYNGKIFFSLRVHIQSSKKFQGIYNLVYSIELPKHHI